MAWQAIGMAVGALARTIIDNKVNQSNYNSAAQTQYVNQSKLNKQAYQYSLKLQNAQNAFNESMMNKANEYNTSMVENANKFTSEMFDKAVDLTNTSHQREVEDLRKAGLNPILSANGGAQGVNPLSGATLASAQTSSGGASMSGGSASMPGTAELDTLSAFQTANQMYNDNAVTNNTVDMGKAERANIYGQLQIAQDNSASQIAKQKAETEQIYADIKNNNALTKQKIANMVAEERNYQQNSAKSRQETANLSYDAVDKQRHVQFLKNQTPLGRTIYNWARGLNFSSSARIR